MWARAKGRFLSRWNDFWFIEGPPEALALVRILIGAFLLFYWLRFLPHVALFFSDAGFCIPILNSPGSLSQVDSLNSLIGYLVAQPSVWRAWSFYLATVMTAGAFLVGFRFRISAALHLLLWAYHWVIYFAAADYSYDRDLFLVVSILMISPCARSLSVDAWLRKKSGKPSSESVSLWTARLICVHLAITYFGAGVSKILAPEWSDGSILTRLWSSDWGTPIAQIILDFGLPIWFWNLAIVGVILFQLAIPFLLFNQRWCWLALVAGSLFHLSNALTMGLWEFLYVPLLYPLFLDPSAVAAWVRKRS